MTEDGFGDLVAWKWSENGEVQRLWGQCFA
jgi:hypothetical protein